MKPFDDVNGKIIGGDYGMAWVTYQGRKQGKTHYCRTELEAIDQCEKYIEQCLSDPAAMHIWTDKSAWKIHLDNF